MIKKIALIAIALAFVAACSKGLSKETYISAMTELGCKGAAENTPAGQKLLKDMNVTQDQINAFRKNMNPNETMQVANEIANRVMACHGIKPPQPQANQ